MSNVSVNVVEPARAPECRRSLWLMLSLAAVLVALVLAGRLWPSAPPATERVVLTRWSQLPNLQTAGVSFDAEQTLDVGLEERELIFGGWPDQVARALEIEVTPLTPGPLDRVLLLYVRPGTYWHQRVNADPAQLKDAFDALDGNLRRDLLPPTVSWDGAKAKLRWYGRDPMVWLKLHWPGAAQWKLESITLELQASASAGLAQHLPLLFKLLLFSLIVGLALSAGVRVLRWQLGPLKTWLLALVLAQQVLLAVLLPPFQGPDENAHWRAALGWLGRGGDSERLLMRLPEVTEAMAPRWCADIPFAPAALRQQNAIPEEAEHANVGYGTPLTYPYVSLVALLFPRVSTVPEALAFFYLCRLLPVVGWLVLLVFTARSGWLTWSLLTFLGLPLVLQQSVVISSDTVVLQGTLAAGLLFLQYRRQPSRGVLVTLWVISIVGFIAKPPLPLPLLPLALLPWGRLPWKPVVLPLVLVAAAGLGWFLLNQGLAMVERSSEKEHAGKLRGRLEWVLTRNGAAIFLGQVVNRFTWSAEAGLEWFEPLGWLDTPLSHHHRLLILCSLFLAVLADLWERGKYLGRRLAEDPWPLIGCVLLVITFATALTLGFALIMYLTHTATEAGQTGLIGMQVRYVYPAVLLACLLPLAPNAQADPLRRSDEVVAILFAAPLLILALVRLAALAVDVVIRYYG